MIANERDLIETLWIDLKNASDGRNWEQVYEVMRRLKARLETLLEAAE